MVKSNMRASGIGSGTAAWIVAPDSWETVVINNGMSSSFLPFSKICSTSSGSEKVDVVGRRTTKCRHQPRGTAIGAKTPSHLPLMEPLEWLHLRSNAQ